VLTEKCINFIILVPYKPEKGMPRRAKPKIWRRCPQKFYVYEQVAGMCRRSRFQKSAYREGGKMVFYSICPQISLKINNCIELELIQTQMTQKPMLRAEVYAHATRASQYRKLDVRREKEVLYFQPSLNSKVDTVHDINFGTRLKSLPHLFLH